MKVLVTGANGMIGSAVVAAPPPGVSSIVAHTGVDATGASQRSTIAEHGRSVMCDITDREALRPVADGVDAVIHLAGPPSVAASFEDPVEFLRAHVLGTATIVQLCVDLGIPRFVHVSSAEVYGRPRRNPVDELEPPAPRSPYASAKVGAESVIGAASRAAGLNAVILRPFSVYGPGARRASVLGRILDQALVGNSIQLQSLDGIRDYCYVGDLADAVWRAATADVDGVRTYNIGSGQGTRVGELAMAALAARDGTIPVDAAVEASAGSDRGRPPAADIPELVADARRARDELGWQTTTSLADGLALTLDWFANAVVTR